LNETSKNTKIQQRFHGIHHRFIKIIPKKKVKQKYNNEGLRFRPSKLRSGNFLRGPVALEADGRGSTTGNNRELQRRRSGAREGGDIQELDEKKDMKQKERNVIILYEICNRK
jgi:hypothetical protein